MDFETIRLHRDGAVAVVTLDRPDDAQTLNMTMGQELARVAAVLDHDASVRAVVITSTGRFFCAGGDVKSMLDFGEGVAAGIKQLADDLHRAISTFARMSAPVIMAVNGVAAGAGFSLAATGDLVLAAESASFTMAYTKIGLSPDGSSSYFLPRLIGLRRTQELMLTNRTLESAEALEWGLVTKVVPDDALHDEAMQLARTIATGSPEAHAAVKTLLLTANPVEAQMELEGRLISACAASDHGREGITAFTERRTPTFR